jgi:hypothetical protein
MSNIRAVHGSRNAKSITNRGLWCEICKKQGHDPYHFPMMQKYQTVPKSSYCNFCKSVGHDDKDCRTMDLMRERTSDAYRVQAEMMTGQATPQFNQVPAHTTLRNNNITLHNNNITLCNHSIISHNHTIIPCSITRRLSIMRLRGDQASYRGGGRERGGFGRGRGPVVCHNCQQPGHYAREFHFHQRPVCIVAHQIMTRKNVRHY